MRKAYCRCNSGHYFAGIHCPLDGWSSPASAELTSMVAAMADAGQLLSLEKLQEQGLSGVALARIVVIEFGSDDSVFDAISPEGYFVGDRWIKQRDFDQRFT